jgi:two-component system, OmpR family, sensor histidine kinase VicK
LIRAPSIVVDIEEYRNGYADIRKRGGKIRAFTEIMKDNIHHCEKLMKLVDELRHLDGVKGGIAVSETEYMATTNFRRSKASDPSNIQQCERSRRTGSIHI